MSFDSIPILDLSLSRDSETKPAFLADLRRALLEVGFLYITNTGIDDALIQDVVDNGKAFFDLPDEAKLAIAMKNQKSFLGYSKLGNEITAHNTDWREQIDLSTPHPIPSPSAPLYHNLLAPNQWPDPALLPSFRPIFERYIHKMSLLSTAFTSLIAESLDLPPTAFDRFFDVDQQHKLKIVKYPDASELVPHSSSSAASSSHQGVGPHKDSMLTSYLLQASAHRGLQAQNLHGAWIDCPPMPGTLVVAIGQGLEALTRGACASTTHRVLSPAAGAGPRFSIPFFQGVSYDATFESVDVPARVLAEKRALEERALGKQGMSSSGGRCRDEVEFTFVKGRWSHLGEATLWNRCKSHGDVAERWYPGIWREICETREREGREGREKKEEEEEDERKGVEDGARVGAAGGVAQESSGTAIQAH